MQLFNLLQCCIIHNTAVVGLAVLLLPLQSWWVYARNVAACPNVVVTTRTTFVYGEIMINGTPAPQHMIVTAQTPRGDVVGCFSIETIGLYGLMAVYGEERVGNVTLPGMRMNEVVLWQVNGIAATANTDFSWSDDRDTHHVVLSVSITNPTATSTVVATTTSSPTATVVNGIPPTLTPVPNSTVSSSATPSPTMVGSTTTGPTTPTATFTVAPSDATASPTATTTVLPVVSATVTIPPYPTATDIYLTATATPTPIPSQNRTLFLTVVLKKKN